MDRPTDSGGDSIELSQILMATEFLHRTCSRAGHGEVRAEGVTQDVPTGWFLTCRRRNMLAIHTAATLSVLLLTAAPAARAQLPPPKASVHIDPASPLDSRVGEADPTVLKMFAPHVPAELIQRFPQRS